MSDITTYIALSIAEGRIKKAKDALRPRMLQAAQLSDDGKLIEDEEGVSSELEDCPVCAASPLFIEGEFHAGFVEVPAPFGLEAARMAQPSTVNLGKLLPQKDILLWAIEHGVFKLSVNNKAFVAFSEDATPESAYNMSVIDSCLTPQETDVLRVIQPSKVKELR